MIFRNFVAFLLVSLFFGCEKYEIKTRDWPVISTLDATSISETGAVLNAQILSVGNSKVISYGFVWCQCSTPTGTSSYKIIIPEAPSTDKFSAAAVGRLVKGVHYAARGFAVIDGYTVYGTTVVFKGQ